MSDRECKTCWGIGWVHAPCPDAQSYDYSRNGFVCAVMHTAPCPACSDPDHVHTFDHYESKPVCTICGEVGL